MFFPMCLIWLLPKLENWKGWSDSSWWFLMVFLGLFFFFAFFGKLPAMLRGDTLHSYLYSGLYSGITPGGPREAYGMPGIEPWSATCKANALPTVIWLWPVPWSWLTEIHCVHCVVELIFGLCMFRNLLLLLIGVGLLPGCPSVEAGTKTNWQPFLVHP